MIPLVATAATLALVIAMGAISLVVIGVRRADRRTLQDQPYGDLDRMVRRVNGLYVRRPTSRFRDPFGADSPVIRREDESRQKAAVS